MTERVDICNIALSMLGEDPITSIDDDTNTAKQLTIQYVPARDATLEAHDWSFAIERFQPALLTEAPLYGPANAFSVPVNILRVIACDNEYEQAPTTFSTKINSKEQIDWVLENGKILCNEEVVWARGIRRVEEEGSFSNLFVQAFAAKLAMLLAINLTASTDIKNQVAQYYEYAISEAKSRDGLQGRSQRIRSRQLLKAR